MNCLLRRLLVSHNSPTSWLENTFSTTTFNRDASASRLVSNNARTLVRAFLALHFDKLCPQLLEDPLHLLILGLCGIKSLVVLLKSLLFFNKFSFSHLEVDLEFGSLAYEALVTHCHLLVTLLKHLDLLLVAEILVGKAELERSIGVFNLVELHLQL